MQSTPFIQGSRLKLRALIVVAAALIILLRLATVAIAELTVIEGDGDASTAGTAVGCATADHYTCLDDGVVQPDTPDTGSDYVSLGINKADRYTVENIAQVDTVSEITVNLFHLQVTSNLQFNVSLYNANGATQYGTTVSLPIRDSGQWDTATFSGLALTQAEMDDLTVEIECVRGGGGGQTNDCRAYAMYLDVLHTTVPNVTVGSADTQQNVDAGGTAQHVGGSFTLTEGIGSTDINSITIAETGSVDAANDLSNVALYYDLDTTNLDCSAETYDGTETQFGSTATAGFSAADGSITFTDTLTVTTSQTACIYVVLDVESTATPGDTIAVEISDPSSDVLTNTLYVAPSTTVAISGDSTIQRTNLTQTGYHWRNDDGSETGATSATAGTESSSLDTAPREQTVRLRMAVSNEGNKTSNSAQYQLEYATKVTSCDAATGWSNPAAAGGNWDMSPTANLTDAADTTNIAVSTGGITDPNTTFVTPNGGVRDTTDTTAGIVLSSSEFIELEYAIEATANAGDGVTYCFRVTDSGVPLDTYDTYAEATTLSDLRVSDLGSQITTTDIPSNDVYAGGAFTVTDQTIGQHEIQSLTVQATGTAAVDSELTNIRVFYEYDTSDPYTCASESYSGTEAQFGSSVSNLTNGQGSFTGSLTVDTTQAVCFYVVYDVASSTVDGGTVNWQISNPSTDLVVDVGDVGPSSLVELSGSTTFVTDIISQTGYHWRQNDGDETDASSATAGTENTTLTKQRTESPIRLRVAVANRGGKNGPNQNYRLEWARRLSTCEDVSTWTNVGAAGGEWDMSDSINLTNGADTTNIAVATGGISDPESTFLTPNGGVLDTTSETGVLSLPADNFVELEYSISATASAIEGATYCFRVSDASTDLDSYEEYPKVQIKEATDYLVQRGTVDITGTSVTLTAGTDYEAPASTTAAFMRITNTLNTGAGSGTEGNADDTTVYISNPENITSSVTLTRPAGATGDTRVAWEIIEYIGAPGGQNELVVRDQGTATYGSAATTVNTATASGVVDDTKVAVFVTGQLNPDTSTNYQQGLSTAAWNGGTDTATFTRGESGNAAALSYAVVEFSGTNWQVQRSEHNYTAAGTTETESITPVNSLSRAFLHTQKRMGANQNSHGDFGHQIRLSGIGQVSYALDSEATTPASHTSVAWIIENTQTAGDVMQVTRSNGTQSSGAIPTLLAVNIGKTLSDLEISSIFMNNSGTETGGQGADSFPEPMMSARILSSTQYELYIADTDDSRSWRTEIVEWPTAARTFTQNYYRFYTNNDTLTPDDPWPSGADDVGENSSINLANIPVGFGQSFRLRMSVQVDAAGAPPGLDAFNLQYAEKNTTCAAISSWTTVGDPTDNNAPWRGYVTSVSDGTALSTDPPAGGDLLLSVSDVAATYEDDSPSSFTPYQVDPGEDLEFDWSVQHNGAKDKTEYCFRMVESNGTELLTYNNYPSLLTAAYEPLVSRWRFYSDAENVTPTAALASENNTPSQVDNTDRIKLRTSVAETAGASGDNVKFKLQFSEYPDFSKSVQDVVASSSCVADSLWCYADGGGEDNEQIPESVISDTASCSGGIGSGCGTHNEGVSTTTATFDHPAFTTTEYEFTIQNAGARVNAVYYFRLYDVNEDKVVAASSSNPSVLAAPSSMNFSIAGLPAGTSTGGVVTGSATDAQGVSFANIPVGEPHAAAQRFTIETNATQGYQVLTMSDMDLMNDYGHTIDPISSSNGSPTSWETACANVANGCFGYHSTDAVLAGGSARFAPEDSYAPFTTNLEEVFYSTLPGTDVLDMVYQVEISDLQPAGVYNTDITYVVVPVF